MALCCAAVRQTIDLTPAAADGSPTPGHCAAARRRGSVLRPRDAKLVDYGSNHPKLRQQLHTNIELTCQPVKQYFYERVARLKAVLQILVVVLTTSRCICFSSTTLPAIQADDMVASHRES